MLASLCRASRLQLNGLYMYVHNLLCIHPLTQLCCLLQQYKGCRGQWQIHPAVYHGAKSRISIVLTPEE